MLNSYPKAACPAKPAARDRNTRKPQDVWAKARIAYKKGIATLDASAPKIQDWREAGLLANRRVEINECPVMCKVTTIAR